MTIFNKLFKRNQKTENAQKDKINPYEMKCFKNHPEIDVEEALNEFYCLKKYGAQLGEGFEEIFFEFETEVEEIRSKQ